ncbi:MAG TPA: hypothetical protein GX692_08270 [Acholeplasmataceae bacterium]|jgi:hypothetical protein|nr:hypothetical protein [Acholeplasmataceae bacterium]
MNKKIIAFIVVFFSLFSVLAIAIAGIQAEQNIVPVQVKEIYFIDEEGYRLSADYYLDPKIDTYQLRWVIKPENAENQEVLFLSSNDEVTITEEGLVFFNGVKDNPTITIISKDSAKSAKITFIRYSIGGGDINPWG